jgi:hypothetical protein
MQVVVIPGDMRLYHVQRIAVVFEQKPLLKSFDRFRQAHEFDDIRLFNPDWLVHTSLVEN